ncbi:GIY-YIG nuclease family protein [Brucella sp.]|uniref:GIY-YIG nuclease family protein n=1 Tax=Brucella sp. TaxID=52132 RepID=UPI0028B0F24A|nr:GIY-YIG nuclease family protein [Brucella sp.]
MTVYFITRKDRQDMVKIGYSDNLTVRLWALAASFPEGIELLATAEGGREVEKVFHKLFDICRVEGEWFKRTRELDKAIAGLGISPEFPQKDFVPKTITEGNGTENDQEIARNLLITIMQSTPSISVGKSLYDAYEYLSAVNPQWSQRRVRAIFHREANSIQHFEVRNLKEVLGNIQLAAMKAA